MESGSLSALMPAPETAARTRSMGFTHASGEREEHAGDMFKYRARCVRVNRRWVRLTKVTRIGLGPVPGQEWTVAIWFVDSRGLDG
jgi:hypothetical protein